MGSIFTASMPSAMALQNSIAMGLITLSVSSIATAQETQDAPSVEVVAAAIHEYRAQWTAFEVTYVFEDRFQGGGWQRQIVA